MIQPLHQYDICAHQTTTQSKPNEVYEGGRCANEYRMRPFRNCPSGVYMNDELPQSLSGIGTIFARISAQVFRMFYRHHPVDREGLTS